MLAWFCLETDAMARFLPCSRQAVRSLIPGCPLCGAPLSVNWMPGAPTWRCREGHLFTSTRALIAELRRTGWTPRIIYPNPPHRPA